jgi:TLC domain
MMIACKRRLGMLQIVWICIHVLKIVQCVTAFQFTSGLLKPRPHPALFVPVKIWEPPTVSAAPGKTRQKLYHTRPSRSNAIPTSTLRLQAFALPTCDVRNVYRLAGIFGMAGLVSQLGLTKLLERSERTRKNAGYTAHTMVALVLMILVSWVGVVGWCWTAMPSTAAERILSQSDSCRWLAAVVFGMFAFWDVPTSLMIPALRKPDVVVHHMIMTVMAYIAATRLPTHYAFFHFGVSELSSVPLLIYDQLSVLTKDKDGDGSRLVKLRDAFQVVAAGSFTVVRALLFTAVTLGRFVPDAVSVLSSSAANAHVLMMLRIVLAASVGFTALQLYWFYKMLRVMFKGEERSSIE